MEPRINYIDFPSPTTVYCRRIPMIVQDMVSVNQASVRGKFLRVMKSASIFSLFRFYWVYRHQYGGYKVILLIVATMLAVFVESLGIATFLPLLSHQPGTTPEPNNITAVLTRIFNFFNLDMTLNAMLGFILVAFTLKMVFKLTQAGIQIHLLTTLLQNLRIDVIEKYNRMSFSFFVTTEIGYFNNLITTEISNTVATFKKYTEIIVFSLNVLIFLGFSFLVNWRVSLLAIAIGLISGCFFLLVSRIVSRLSLGLSRKNIAIQNLFIQYIFNFKYLKATNNFRNLFDKIVAEIKNWTRLQQKTFIIRELTRNSLEPVAVFIFVGLIFYMVGLKGETIMSVLLPMLFFYKTISQIFQAHVVFNSFLNTSGGVVLLEEAWKNLEKYKEQPGGRAVEPLHSDLRLKNVRFSHGDKLILDDVSIVIPKKHSIGIVGESGAGKTTILDMIVGLYPPHQGAVEYDGIDYRELDKGDLRSNFGYLTQDPVIFNDTIANNISFWSQSSNGENYRRSLENAAKLSYSLDFIQDTREGFNSFVGDKGIKLSGGQRQRLSIAREFFHNREIIIFDEATSSLDSESEALIQNSIQEMMGKKTMIIVSHRLSTIRNCDYIYVVQKGRVVQEGKWEDLVRQRDSFFWNMCLLQGLVETGTS